MLAETYDPLILSTWGTYGTRGDATKARELYAKAHAGGIQEAKDRFDALRSKTMLLLQQRALPDSDGAAES